MSGGGGNEEPRWRRGEQEKANIRFSFIITDTVAMRHFDQAKRRGDLSRFICSILIYGICFSPKEQAKLPNSRKIVAVK